MGFQDRLKKESSRWVSDGILTDDQRGQILGLYKAPGNPLFVLFAVVGTLLLGTGIILVFATNWWRLPVPIKLLLACIPMAAAQGVCFYARLRRPGSMAFREGSALFLTLSIFAGLALIGQTFHSPYELDGFVLTCILLALPGIYLLRARAAAVVYICGAIWFGVSGEYGLWMALAVVALILPLLALEIRRTDDKLGLWLLSLMLSGVVAYMLLACMLEADADAVVIVPLCALALIGLDGGLRRYKTISFHTPAHALGCAVILVGLIVYSFPLYDTVERTGWTFLPVVFAAGYGLFLRDDTRRVCATDLFVAAAPLMAVFPVWPVANLMLLVIGGHTIQTGAAIGSLRRINLGMLLVVLLIVLRFFESGLGLLARGIAFILIGLIFLGVNLLMKKREGNSLEPNHGEDDA